MYKPEIKNFNKECLFFRRKRKRKKRRKKARANIILNINENLLVFPLKTRAKQEYWRNNSQLGAINNP